MRLENIERQFYSHLAEIPKLRNGVKSGLNAIASMDIPIWILTEGPKEKCERLLIHYEIQHLIERIMEGKKGATIYRRIRKLGGYPDFLFMVGDQIDRDIQYANCEEYITIYYPGGFTPRWSADVQSSHANYNVSDYLEAATIVKDCQSSGIMNSQVISKI